MNKVTDLVTFLEKARIVHKEDNYSYEKVEYISNKDKVIITCSQHGDFLIAPNKFLNAGQGCPECAKIKRSNTRRLSEQEAKSKIIELLGDKYGFEKFEYKGLKKDKFILICPIHGEFETNLETIVLKHRGCPECGKAKQHKEHRSSTEEFIAKAKAKFGDKYDYSLTKYTTSKSPVIIICPIHGKMSITPQQHLRGDGCNQCGMESLSKKSIMSKEDFIKRANEIHHNKYDYSKVVYEGCHKKVRVICPIHGEFLIEPNGHIGKQEHGCPKCGIDAIRLTQDEFLTKANKVHHNKYDYSKAKYTGGNNSIVVICPKHGEFKQIAKDHLCGRGCPRCSNKISENEDELVSEFKKSYFGKIVQSDRRILKGQELDIYFPKEKVAIEVNGNYWHSEIPYYAGRGITRKLSYYRDHQLEKFKKCEEAGICLFNLYEDEIKNKSALVIQMILNRIGIYEFEDIRQNYRVGKISQKSADDFYEAYHLEGSLKSKLHYGLIDKKDDTLVSLMTFEKVDNSFYRLLRYSSYGSIKEGYKKIFQHFLKKHPKCKVIEALSDNRYDDGVILKELGFVKIEEVKPDYYYINESNISCRTPRADFDNPKEAMANGFYRLWEAGKKKWQMNIKRE